MNVGSLFSGIGGFDLGFERAGMQISWQVELDAFCRAVLARHFPDASRFEDVREVGVGELESVDLICGGFPCQDLSNAGRGAGIGGARSGLWSEFARIIRELRPSYVVVENVPALLTGKGKRWERGPIGRVLGDLAEVGYDAEWACLSAREFGAPHLRKRVWIVAYPSQETKDSDRTRTVSDSDCDRRSQGLLLGAGAGELTRPADTLGSCPDEALADPKGVSQRPRLCQGDPCPQRRGRSRDSGRARGTAKDTRRPLDNPDSRRHRAPEAQVCPRRDGALGAGRWAAEPDVGRVANGVPHRVDRLAALGNALVPQIAEWIGGRILGYEGRAEAERPAACEVSPGGSR